MRFAKKTVTEEAIDKIGQLKGPDKSRQGAMRWIAIASANRDKNQQRRSIHIARKTQASFQKAFPNVDPEFIGLVVADLDSLWDLRQKFDKDLDRLFQMRFPQHRNHLRAFLIDLETRQLEEGHYLISRLRKRLPKLLKELDRQERTEPRVGTAKPGKTRGPRAPEGT